MATDVALGDRLAARTLELIDIPSVSRDEAALADHIEALVPEPFELLYRSDDSLFYATGTAGEIPLVVLAGHLDTVPAQENPPGRIDDGTVWGLGASDMKSGLAVMVELARWLAEAGPSLDLDLGLLFFGREELPPDESRLPALFAAAPALNQAQLVVMMEPTDNTIQAGCLGHVSAELAFTGVSAHSARPWLGVNAVGVAVEGLRSILELEPRPVVISGLRFVEVLSVTGIAGGIAGNVIPDRVRCQLSYRYAPDRSPEDAEQELRRLTDGSGTLTVIGNSPPAHVVVDSPLVARLRRAGDFAVEPKQAWTPVAEFAARGLDAVNLGPGATRYAHSRDEQVEVTELVRTYGALQGFLLGEEAA